MVFAQHHARVQPAVNKQPTRRAFDANFRVVMLTSQFLPEVYGGAEQQCLRLSVALAERGARPVIVTSRSDPRTPAEETVTGIPVYRLLTPHPPQSGGTRIASTVRWLAGLRQWFRSHAGEVDLIHCHQAKINAYAGVRAARRYGWPSVVKIGTATPNFDLHSLAKKRWVYGRTMARYVAAHAGRFVAISDNIIRNLADYGIPEKRCVKIPNGITLRPIDEKDRERRRKAMRDHHEINAGEYVLLFAGRMEPQKNIELLLNATARLNRPTRILLCGDGTYLPQYARLAHELGLHKRVHFLGRVNDISDYLAAADLFVLPTKAEGMSNSLLEAMAMAVPCVASKVSGNVDLIEHGESGWLFEIENGEIALRDALEAALKTDDEARAEIGRAGRRQIERNYDMAMVADRYLELYRSLLVPSDKLAI